MAEIAAEVSRLRATGLVLVADTWWLASPEELPPGKRPGEVKERREGLMAIGIRSDGERRVLFTPYRRRFRRIQLGETMEISVIRRSSLPQSSVPGDSLCHLNRKRWRGCIKRVPTVQARIRSVHLPLASPIMDACPVVVRTRIRVRRLAQPGGHQAAILEGDSEGSTIRSRAASPGHGSRRPSPANPRNPRMDARDARRANGRCWA
jgi:hypothetical protein